MYSPEGGETNGNTKRPHDTDELNTQLRDFYSSLDELCSALDLNREELEERLGTVDFHYNKERNQFV